MKAEILSIGTELLLGDIINTNAQYLSKRLADLGILVYHQTVVGDNEERIINAFRQGFEHADLIITTGGLGPTSDDITKEVGSSYFNKKLILDEYSLQQIKNHFLNQNKTMTDNNIKQAYFPEGCTILKNKNGTAPGCIIDEKNKILIILPGPPREMKAMFEESVVPYLSKHLDGVLVSKVLRTYGLGESIMASMVSDIIQNSKNPTVAPYAKDNEAILRITAKATNIDEAKNLINPIEKEIRTILGDNIYGEDEDTLQSIVAEMLLKRHLTISTSESCTGGLLAAKLIDYPGISEVFIEGSVTYSNEAKMNRLNVRKETLEKYGAVSSQTAEEMAVGIAKTSNTNIGLSTTGIAGPGGGTKEKPVGLVYIGMYINGSVKVKELHLTGNRERIRNKAVLEVLNWLRLELLRNK